MRLIRRSLFFAILGVDSVAAFNCWSENGWPLRPSAAVLDADAAKQQAARLANRVAAKASDAANRLGDSMIKSALTANIRSKMALDDYVKAHDQRRHVRVGRHLDRRRCVCKRARARRTSGSGNGRRHASGRPIADQNAVAGRGTRVWNRPLLAACCS